jgi:hypothetical protein
MGIASAELAVQRQLTAAFIAADDCEVTLYRSSVTPDGAGGEVRGEPTPLAPQVFRLIPQGGTGADSKERFTRDGQAVSPDYILLGDHQADMQRWDTFTLGGRQYELVFVNQNRQYETKAEVVYRAE